MRRRTLATAALAVMAVTACSAGDDTADPPAPPSRALPALPADPDAAFVQIGAHGVPAITADGRVFRTVEQPAGFARPTHAAAALPLGQPVGALEVAQLTDDGLRAVLRRAAELELLQQPPDYGAPGITDQGSLVVRLSTAGATYEHDVYAPDEDVDDPDAQAARDRLDDFVGFVGALREHVGDELGPWIPYVPEQWVVDVGAYVDPTSADAWPFDAAPMAGCTTFDVAGDTAGDIDTVSGVYLATVPGADDDQVVEVRPALPFTAC